MKRQLQIKNGIAGAEWNGSGGMPVPPDATWTFVDVTDRPEAVVGMTYDAATDTFGPAPVVVKTLVTPSQVISVLTAAEWQIATTSTDADVVWGMAQFQLATRIDLVDPQFAALMSGLVAKGIVTADRAADIQSDLMALANA
ncbi:hypothetical protein UFOVP1017_1 [uncultured Caudovirales phage]|uniref:Uncharacterized protein n=1 Tax=uncultured Caudovirales phage TaxID=2100421 RepID=A0A6J5MLM3_9CAUD|nr:hypothetical protein UFOVP511_1 [uncultured Caudovirales phage]CAB4178468.1 hypothetical protein UFOVP1017_1 [uncultured Caudovirales phage]CAB4187771.1 hypothetical protein UFOVP1168_1 [uncultured Caudovirales phage]CAB4219624.1 hypothetical protein UFOVP1617_52 [uncultured Caudovirales phage]